MSNTPFCFDPELRQQVMQLLLPDVQLPGQYIGGEPGRVIKTPESVRGRFCFAFPDTYPIGMSHFGMALLYSIMNRFDDWACERVFCPYPDFEKVLHDNRLPLYSLETFTPFDCFDVVGFSLQYELAYTNVLTMLSLAQIPLRSEERRAADPLIIAGGPAVFNPEPMAAFFDLFVIGDGEEALPELCRYYQQLRDEAGIKRRLTPADSPSRNSSDNSGSCGEPAVPDPLRRELLLALARKFPWVYVPAFYDIPISPTGRSMRPRPNQSGVPEFISPATVKCLDDYPPATTPLVPLVESVQDRISIEIMRGCPQKCRFCQSWSIKRPLRFRSAEQIVQLASDTTENSGITDVTLLSLSSSDYPRFDLLLESLGETIVKQGCTISLPSLRVNHQLSDVMSSLSTKRSSSITLAPEAARDVMRRRIAKEVTHEDLLAGCRAAFENGFDRIKMYFMVGFPDETIDDVIGIIELCEEIARLGKSVRGRFPTIVANVSNFVPKPQTPLQWSAMASSDYFREAHSLLKRSRRLKSVDVKYHSLATSLLEGVLARGDRRAGEAVYIAWKNGARLDAWSDYFQNRLWEDALQQAGISRELLAETPYAVDEELPWDHITTTVPKEKLMSEYKEFLS